MNFVFPNEVHVHWTSMIVLYPYISGLVAGVYIVASLHHLFGREELAPISRFALASTFVFLLFVPLPLLIHLGHPERAFNIMVTSNFSSAMAGFGYLYVFYLLIVTLEVWFAFRRQFVALAGAGGWRGMVFRAILLYDLRDDPATRAGSHKISKILAIVGIPTDFMLTGYVGFLFGTVKANPWWSTSMMLLIFFTTALVSGAAVVLFHYLMEAKIARWQVSRPCVRTLNTYLAWFTIFALVLQGLEVLAGAYQATADWNAIYHLITGKLLFSYIVLQLGVCGVLPLLMLGLTKLYHLEARAYYLVSWVAAVLLLGHALLVRWNIVIGGQLMSKSFRGYTDFTLPWLDKEGLISAIVVFTLPFLILYMFHRIIPLFSTGEPREASGLRRLPQSPSD